MSTIVVGSVKTPNNFAPSIFNSSGVEIGVFVNVWANIDGSTNAIRASNGVSSLTDQGTGQWLINFTRAFPDKNYCLAAITGGQDFTSFSYGIVGTHNEGLQKTYAAIRTTTPGNNGVNPEDKNLLIVAFR